MNNLRRLNFVGRKRKVYWVLHNVFTFATKLNANVNLQSRTPVPAKQITSLAR